MRAIVFLLLQMAATTGQPALVNPAPAAPASSLLLSDWFLQIPKLVRACAKTPRPDALASVTGPTFVLFFMSNGAVDGATLIKSSGNSDLDRRAVKCYRALPPQPATATRYTGRILSPFYWTPTSQPPRPIVPPSMIVPPSWRH
jgi:TonB family protein